MKLLPLASRALTLGTAALLMAMPAGAGGAEEAMQAWLDSIPVHTTGAEWHNPWLAQARARADAQAPSADRQMAEILAGYTRALLDRGCWDNALLKPSGATPGH